MRMRWMWTRALLVGALGLVAGSSGGCAEEREPINRVQPNALQKSFFVGADLQSPDDDPEFWSRPMVVDVGYGAGQDGLFSASYGQAEMTRIKWQITEDLLLGRITYERIEDTDGKGVGGKAKEGVIAVAFKITKHFDIRRDYNPTTGEELNIIGENDTDRAWNEREYMRVDFSQNLNTNSYDFDTLSLIGIFGGVKYEPLAYYVNDPEDPDAPHFDPESNYFDITTKAFATPELIDLSALGWGINTFPACFLDADFMGGDAPSGTCNPVELTIRHSFRRVVDRDYEPKNWDGYQFQAYGPFMKERKGYARNYGMSDDKWYRFATLYNIWERSHYYDNAEAMTGAIECYTPETTPYGSDPNRDEDTNGTDDECEEVTALTGFGGSRCDKFSQKCTLPYQARTEVPQVWYVTANSNYEYFDGTEWATHEWDVAFRSAVRVAKFSECMRTTGNREACQASYPVWSGQHDDNADAITLAREVDDCRNGRAYDGEDCDAVADRIGGERGYSPAVIDVAKAPEMLVLCHSPVEAGDPEACGGPRLPADMTAGQCAQAVKDGDESTLATCRRAMSVRMGDLRYHTVNLFDAPQSPSSWGIYTDSEDPLTGEKVSASINVWTHVNDLWSQGIIDQARYIKGELKTEDVTDGTYVRDWASAAEAASRGAYTQVSRTELDARMEALTGATGPIPAELGDAALVQQIRQIKSEARAVKADAKAATTSQAIYEMRRQHARGTEFEAQLVTPAMQQLAGVDGMPVTDGLLDHASPLRMLNPSIQRQIKQMKEVALAERGSCVLGADAAADAPLSITGLADVLEQKFGAFDPTQDKATQQARAERMRRYIAQRAQYAVIVHEMGHSIGERHNFVSSSDAFNYRPQYWQLRTKNGKVDTACTDLVADGASCVGPRYFDPMTDEERENLLWMFMASSTMDYAGEASQDLLGIGAYDFAAARMFYGDAVAVFANEEFKVDEPRGSSLLSWKTDNFGGIVGISPEYDGEGIHYSQLQRRYEILDCGPDNAGYWSGDEAAVQRFKPATWNEERDGAWHPVADGQIVKVDGVYSRCKQQPVDYVQWRSLRSPKVGTGAGAEVQFYRGGPAIDPQERTRVPYGFATDRWADLGNLSVYRHDNGADPYELFSFFIAQQEVGHVFDNYRRNRTSFSVRGASNRTLERFNAKMRDGAKGIGLLLNIYKDFAQENSYNFEDLWPYIARASFPENILASGIAFDHFTRLVARPQPGEHYQPDYESIFRSSQDAYGGPNPTDLTAVKVNVPNGATGYFGNISYGGKPLENALSEDKGEYDSEFTVNAGGYYDKVWTPMLMAESVDNFISDSRQDFLDSRYRAVSLADLFPDGYRRWLANNLTGDDMIKGIRIAAAPNGDPLLEDGTKFPEMGIGWTSWWTKNGPEVCFPGEQSTVCSSYTAIDNGPFNPQAPANVAILDPQVGWEQQKFLIAMTLQYLPENQKRYWLDQMMIWRREQSDTPVWDNRIEFHDPTGAVYLAKTYGTEVIFGKTVQRSVAARVLEYANELLNAAYVTTPASSNGTTWYEPVVSSGKPLVKFDPSFQGINPNGTIGDGARTGCEPLNPLDTSRDEPSEVFYDCTCQENRACAKLEKYISVVFFMRQAIDAYHLCVDDDVKGIYDLPSCQ